MNILDPRALEELRNRYRNHARPSELLREIIRLLGVDCCHTLDLVANVRAVFGLSLAEASPIGGWSEDGTGELKDVHIDGFLTPAIERHRSQWDAPHTTNA